MNRDSIYEDDEDDDIGEDLEDLRRACMISEPSSGEDIAKSEGGGGKIASDSENEDDFEMLKSIKCQLASSRDVNLGGDASVGLSSPSGSESEADDDLEMLQSLKRQMSLDVSVAPMVLSEEDDDSFETLGAIRRRFSAYENFDPQGNFMTDSTGKKQQVHASDNEPSSQILSRSNTCESFPDHGTSLVTVLNSEGVQAAHSAHVHENTAAAVEPFGQVDTCHSSLLPPATSNFPESALAFVDAIRRNRSYQKFLLKKLAEMEAAIEQNKKHQKNVKIVQDFQASCKRMTKQALSQRKDPRVELISTQKSLPCDSSEGNDKKTSPSTLGPPENPTVALYLMALEKYPVSVYRKSWSTEENKNLAKGVKQQVQQKLLGMSSDFEGSTDDADTIHESIKNLVITPEMIRQFLPINWDQLASMYFKDRSAAECEARWMSSEDPLFNHGPWTAAEDKKLRLVIQEKGSTDWCDIAVSLGTNRTPFKCLARYQRSLNPDILGREWTAEEDDQLRAAVELFGENDWQSVANILQERTGKQCSERWKKSLHPSRKRVGKWNSEEDKRLKVAVTLFGAKNWYRIAHFVPGRTLSQCRERWKNCLDPKLNRGKWSMEEDAKLREGINEHGYNSWSKVALHLPGRTDNQCWRRWKSLYPHQALLVKEATRLRKEASVGNFVDRESERPALVASDFLAPPEIPLEPESQVVAVKRKRKARQKADAECEREVSCAATERPPKRRKKGSEKCSGDVCIQENESVCESELNNGGEVMLLGWHNETRDSVKAKKQRRSRRRVAATSDNSTVTTNCPRVKIGTKKLKPRREVSAAVPIVNQDA